MGNDDYNVSDGPHVDKDGDGLQVDRSVDAGRLVDVDEVDRRQLDVDEGDGRPVDVTLGVLSEQECVFNSMGFCKTHRVLGRAILVSKNTRRKVNAKNKVKAQPINKVKVEKYICGTKFRQKSSTIASWLAGKNSGARKSNFMNPREVGGGLLSREVPANHNEELGKLAKFSSSMDQLTNECGGKEGIADAGQTWI